MLNIFTIPLFLAAVFLVVLAVIVYNQRELSGSLAFCGLMIAGMIYTLGYALEISSFDQQLQLFWLKFQYFGTLSIPTLMLIFSLQFTGKGNKLNLFTISAILLVPIIILILIFNVENHQLYYKNIEFNYDNQFGYIVFDRGLFYWINIIHINLFAFLSLMILIFELRHSTKEHKKRLIIIISGAFLPWLGHIIYLAKVIPNNLDIVPYVFFLSSICFFIGIYRFKIFQLLPIAKASLFNLLPDPVLVIDNDNVLLALNQIAKELFEIDEVKIGFSIDIVLREYPEVLKVLRNETKNRELLVRNRKKATDMYYSVQIIPLEIEKSSNKGKMVLLRDITTTRKIESEQKRLAAAVEQSGDVIVITDIEANIEYVNPAFELVTGYKKEEVLGENPRLLNSGAQDDSIYINMWETLTSGFTWRGRFINKKKDGTIYTEDATVAPIKNSEGETTNYVAVKRDITDFLIMQQEIERLVFAIEQSDEVVLIMDIDGRIEYTNPAFEGITGYTQAEALGKKITMLRSDKHPQAFYDTLWESISRGVTWKGRLIRKRKDGSEYYEKTTISPIFDSKREITNFVAISQDITTQMVAEEKLRLSEEKYRAIAESAFVGIFTTDVNNKIQYTNDAFVRLTGYSKEELQQADLSSLIDTILYESKLSVSEHFETSLINKNGDEINVLLTNSPTTSNEGIINGSIAIAIDFSERKKAIEAIKESAQIKSQFVSMVSHELKIPLTVIKEGISLVSDETAGEINEDQKMLLDNVQQNIERLSRLIGDVLDFQKMEKGKMPFEPELSDINTVILEAVYTMTSTAKKKGLYLETDLSVPLPKVYFDRDRITQVLINLIGNAINHTKMGRIVIHSTINEMKNELTVYVQDTGEGIEKEDIGKLFREFGQVRKVKDKKGTGLGLLISKQIVSAHGGNIWLESELHKGTTVYFTIPFVE